MNNIPDEVRRRIEEKYQSFFWTDEQFGFTNESPVPKMQRDAAAWGYSLASEKLKEKDEEISRLKADVELANSGRSEYFRMFNEQLRNTESLISENAKLKAENERLRVLLTKLRNNYLYETDEEGTPKALLSEMLDLWNDVNIELIPPPPKTKSK